MQEGLMGDEYCHSIILSGFAAYREKIWQLTVTNEAHLQSSGLVENGGLSLTSPCAAVAFFGQGKSDLMFDSGCRFSSDSLRKHLAKSVKFFVQLSTWRRVLFPALARTKQLYQSLIKDPTYVAGPNVWLMCHVEPQ